MCEEQRPREKALRQGIQTLSDLELVALLLQSGNKNRSVFDIAQDVLQKTEGLSRLLDLHVNTLMEIKGIREVKALQLIASVELCRRIMRSHAYRTEIRDTKDVLKWVQLEYGFLSQENFVAMYLNTKGRIIAHKVLAIGTLNEAHIHPRDIFKEAFLQNAAGLICVHNHPSGDPTPSDDDYRFTKQLLTLAHINSINFLDHVIVAKEKYFSFRQAGELD